MLRSVCEPESEPKRELQIRMTAQLYVLELELSVTVQAFTIIYETKCIITFTLHSFLELMNIEGFITNR